MFLAETDCFLFALVQLKHWLTLCYWALLEHWWWHTVLFCRNEKSTSVIRINLVFVIVLNWKIWTMNITVGDRMFLGMQDFDFVQI